MSRWTELFENHPIHDTLKWLRECVSSEFNDLDENEAIEKRRFIKLLSKYEEVLEGIDVELLPFNQLDSLNNALRNANFANQINAFKEKENVANLVEANNLFTNQITQLCLLFSLAGPSESHKPLKDIEELIDSSTNSLVQKKDKLKKDIEALQSKSQEQDGKLLSLEQLIEKNKTEVESHITNWQSQFSTAQETRSQDYNNWRNTFATEAKKEIDDLVENQSAKLESNNNTFSQKIQQLLSDGNEKHRAILDLYEITAGDSVGAGYIQNANDEGKQANFWRGVSVLFIILTVSWMLFAYFSISTQALPQAQASSEATEKKEKVTQEKQALFSGTHSDGIPWYKLFITFSLSGVLLWGSAYSAQQSTKHRSNEKRNRWLALEVKAIDPFISSLDDLQQKEIKRQLTERIFGQSSNTGDDNPKVIDEHILKVVTDAIGGIISKLPK